MRQCISMDVEIRTLAQKYMNPWLSLPVLVYACSVYVCRLRPPLMCVHDARICLARSVASRVVWILRWCHRGRHHNTLRCSQDQVRKSAMLTSRFIPQSLCCRWKETTTWKPPAPFALTLTLALTALCRQMLDINTGKYADKGMVAILKSIGAEEGAAGEHSF